MPVLIYIFNMGVAGAGIASLASRALGAVVMLVLLRNRNNPVSVRQLHRIRFQPTMIKNIMRIGVPNGLENSMFQIGKILTSSLIASFGTGCDCRQCGRKHGGVHGMHPGNRHRTWNGDSGGPMCGGRGSTNRQRDILKN